MDFSQPSFFVFALIYFTIAFCLVQANVGLANRNRFLLASSLLLYGYHYPPGVLIILYYVVLARIHDAIYLSRTFKKGHRRRLFSAFVAAALLPLLAFKYASFFRLADSTQTSLYLPIGISFFCFGIIGYFSEVYRKAMTPVADLAHLGVFVAFWPHLAAGPILRGQSFFESLRHRKEFLSPRVYSGLLLVALGIMKKLLIANNLATYVDWNIRFGFTEILPHEAWVTLVGYAGQIYADFSGYSDMAIGFSMILGFDLPANFNFPYRARSLSDFWSRWHISLSTWFRDYLFIPLGGSRKSGLRTSCNILIVFLLSGLWHGASLNFVIWGALHGLGLCVERAFSWCTSFRPPAFIRWSITFLFVTSLWAVFRVDASSAELWLKSAWSFSHEAVSLTSPYYVIPILFFITLMAIEHWVGFYSVDPKTNEIRVLKNPARLFALAGLFVLTLFFSGFGQKFIYFQF